MKTSIKSKIISLFLALQVLTLSIIGLYLGTNIKTIIYRQMDTSMLKQVNLLRELLVEDLRVGARDELQQKSERFSHEVNGRITVIATDGTVLADTEENPQTMENHRKRPEIMEAAREGVGWALRYSTTLDYNMRYLVQRVEPYGYVRLAIPVTEVQHTLFGVFSRVLIGFGLAFAVFLFLSWRMSEKITEPIERITQAAQKIAHGNLAERIHVYSNDEIGTLSRMFNLMAFQLNETIRNIKNEKERLATILENMADGLIALDGAQKVILINPTAARMFGVQEDDVKGKSLIEMSRNPQLVEAVKNVLETKSVMETEIQLIFPQEITLHSHVAPIVRHQQIHGMVLIFTDITGLRRLERMRTEFVGNVSHELKTPLTSIKGYVETLLDMEIDHPMVNKFLGVISKESERLSRLIGDLLDLSRLEGKRNGQLVPTRLQDVMDNVITILQTEADKKQIALKVFIPPLLPRVMGIEEQLNQVFINLIENAIKYTSDGGRVVVSAEADEKWVTLRVADNGVGIPPEDLDRIFERFYRVDKARSRQAGGTGLGLSIVKHIVKGHGGDIWVESRVGEGSTFTVKFQREGT